ncbi:MAG TPA: tetratricopeptide repeat protein [Caldimonas sp.]|jgi:predicted ATPase/DNA-binding winged helix-turn-helix (wHTH) protein
MPPVYRFGSFRLDAGIGSLTRDDRPTGLGPRAVGLLQVLLARSNQYVSKSELLDVAWPGVVVEEANLAVQMSAIRRVLAQASAEVRIETLPRRGYRLLGTVSVERGAQSSKDIEVQTAGAPPSVPAEPDRFVGRRVELEGLAQQWLNGARLITVTGTAGSGKTRLARRYALANLEAWSGGIYFCDLSEARTEDGICFAVASALGVQVTGKDPAVSLGHAIAGHARCLLILDNFEQVSAFAPTTVGRWLERSALASFMVTSRERLRIGGETLFPLEPLPLDTDAVELFRVRAQAQRPEFSLDAEGTEAVRRIVQLVDGLPLAIELAAARARVMSLGQIAERMSHRFRVLVGARGSDRQATMRAAIDWSWNLLTAWEQSALAMCSVFEGGFTLRAAEAVVDLAGWSNAPPVADVVESLIDKSVLRISMADVVGGGPAVDEPHLAMYLSINEYASERLDALGPDVRRLAEGRHGRHFATFGSEDSIPPTSAEEQLRLRRVRAVALDNLVAAYRRATARGDLETMVPAYRAIWEVLEVRGPAGIAVDLGSELPPLRPDADELLVAGHLVRAQALRVKGQSDVAANLLDTIIVLTHERGDRRREGAARHALGMLLRNTGRGAEALMHLERALQLHRQLGDRLAEARTLTTLGNIYLDESRYEEAKSNYRAALEVHREIRDVGDRQAVLSNLGIIALYTGDFDEARRLWDEALKLSRLVDDRRTEGLVLCNLGQLAELSQRPHEALVLLEAALLIYCQVGDRSVEGRLRYNIGDLLLALDEYESSIGCLEASLKTAVEIGDRELEGLAIAGLGRVYEQQQDLEGARVHLERSVEIFRSISSRRAEGIALGGLAMVLARLGMLDEARTAFTSGAELLRQANDPVELGKLLCAQARAERDAGERDKAKALVAEAQRLADSLHSQGGSVLSSEIDELRNLI